MDVQGDWQRIWLLVGDPQRTGLATAPDPPDSTVYAEPPTWAGVPLTVHLARALWTAGRVADTYRMRPAPAGVVALGLLADRGSGATHALLAGRGATHAHLLRAIQADILKTTLPNLGAIIPAATIR
jgi:hypothetical protein